MFEKIRPYIRAKIQPLLWKFYNYYARKDRWHSYQGIKVLVKPTVFHPGFLISTHIFVDFLATIPLQNKEILEIGTGTGLIALYCHQQGADVVASDINAAAIASVQESCMKNKMFIDVIHSDLFNQIPQQLFDYIISNPPYFPQTAKDDKEKAFFCGPEFEFFQRFFKDTQAYLSDSGSIFMILSDDCDIEKIKSIALSNTWTMLEVYKVKKWGEWNMIYQLKKQL